jgi:hypothetical protein
MRFRVNAFVTQTMIKETWLPSRCLAMDGRSDSDIIQLSAARHSILTLPLSGCYICYIRSMQLGHFGGVRRTWTNCNNEVLNYWISLPGAFFSSLCPFSTVIKFYAVFFHWSNILISNRIQGERYTVVRTPGFIKSVRTDGSFCSFPVSESNANFT